LICIIVLAIPHPAPSLAAPSTSSQGIPWAPFHKQPPESDCGRQRKPCGHFWQDCSPRGHYVRCGLGTVWPHSPLVSPPLAGKAHQSPPGKWAKDIMCFWTHVMVLQWEARYAPCPSDIAPRPCPTRAESAFHARACFPIDSAPATWAPLSEDTGSSLRLRIRRRQSLSLEIGALKSWPPCSMICPHLLPL